MLGFGGNAMGGTTLTEDGNVVGFTMKSGRYYVAYMAKGDNVSCLGSSFGSDREAVGRVMARRHAVSAARN
ncbi:hypothetical protein ACTMTF_15270 [Nonomuraea sp. ZG12]|uniref:hypothetical protein n=1 Tax=Nonomuraea sp. ZG12 TaxID=3452207 RepID=UPI003F8A27FD